jgi:hypothetical protein
MPGVILPNTFVRLLAAFEPCFRAPSYRNFDDAKQSLGLADPPAQAARAVRRTAPLACLVLDMLTALRHAGWRRYFSAPPCPARRTGKPLIPWPDAVLATA